jgi:hypothetical protein
MCLTRVRPSSSHSCAQITRYASTTGGSMFACTSFPFATQGAERRGISLRCQEP